MINSQNDRPNLTTPRSIGELIASIKTEVNAVINQQIEIAKKEITALVIKFIGIALALAIVVFLLLSTWVMLLFAGAYALVALGLPPFAGFLIVAGILIFFTIVAALVAYVIFKKLSAPEVTVETTKSAISAFQGKGRVNPEEYDSAFEELYGKQVEN